MTRSLAEWLEYQQRIHPREVALGLDRVRDVWLRLGAPRGGRTVITVGGTNGKGSTVAFLDAIIAESGRAVGAFTSPHLLRYNERIRIAGVDVDDAALLEAFARIERARGPIPLTYFEFGTLAALSCFEQAGVEVAVLEVGLGGRLDAVNVVDADAAIVTTVDYDHMDYLGNELGAIALEKAGIFRAGRPAIVGAREPPCVLTGHARAIGARLEQAGVDFDHRSDERGWTWTHRDGTRHELPLPRLAATAQLQNASAAIAVLHAMRASIPVDAGAIAGGVARATVPGRLQQLRSAPDVRVDVGHNPQAARELAAWLRRSPARGRTIAVFAALADKDLAGVVAPLAAHVDEWHLAGLERESPRGADAATLEARVGPALSPRIAASHADVGTAIDAALAGAQAEDRVLVFGSFFTVAVALRRLGPDPSTPTV
ncbi:MAG TPA: bifunctional tetrahydrofolate synthase/dihydrofolate synthase [Candidatus Saccharimonadia bacterium]|nr:bifunctional tetrahydrofolate synthase/dihydrofolate synthase [Candidatus Saccharimonadia bacterium]